MGAAEPCQAEGPGTLPYSPIRTLLCQSASLCCLWWYETHTTPEMRPVPVHFLDLAGVLLSAARSCTELVPLSLGITRSSNRLLPGQPVSALTAALQYLRQIALSRIASCSAECQELLPVELASLPGRIAALGRTPTSRTTSANSATLQSTRRRWVIAQPGREASFLPQAAASPLEVPCISRTVCLAVARPLL